MKLFLLKRTRKFLLNFISAIVLCQTIAYADTFPIYGVEDKLGNLWAVYIDQKYDITLSASDTPPIEFPGSLQFTKNGRKATPSEEALRLLLHRIGSQYDNFQSFLLPGSVVYDKDEKFYRHSCIDAKDLVLCGLAFPLGVYSYNSRVNTYKEIIENALSGAIFKSDLLVQIPLSNGDVFVVSKIPENIRKMFDWADLRTGFFDPIEKILTDQEALDKLQTVISNMPVNAKDPFIDKFSGFLKKYKLLQPVIGGSLNIAQYLTVREALNTSRELYYYRSF